MTVRLPDVPAQVYEEPRRGEPTTILAIRIHLGHCRTCQGGQACDRLPGLITSYKAGVRIAGG